MSREVRYAKKACLVCGAEFVPRSSNAKTCGPDCRAKKKALAKRMACASPHWAKPGAPGYLPLTASEAERLRRALGYESYGKATEAAMSRGQTLTQFLTIEAVAAGIDLEKEAIT